MARIQIRNKTTGEDQYITQTAIETPITDLEGNYQYKNVEMALQEIGEKIKNGVATPNDIKQIKAMIDIINDNIADIEAGGGSSSGIEGIDTKVLKEMVEKYERGELGSGGGGAVSPTIESEFPTESIIEEGSSISIDIYFQTPNLGDGKLYITVNNAEIDYSPTIKQGDNKIAIAAKYLTKTNNTISIYAKDRVGMTSNRLTFKVVSGGVTLTTTFDYTVDYVVGQNILFPFTTVTELEGEIYLHMTIDGINVEPIQCSNGYNSLYLNNYITGVGSHTVSMYAMVGSYKSKVLNFNVVIASSTELTLSTSTLSGTEFTYGESIQISYRVSKLGNETFTMSFYVDEELKRTSSVSTGSYFWTIAAGEIPLGTHTIKIKAEGTSGDSAEIEIQIVVVAGTFKPIEIIKSGLTCWLDSDGYSNEMEERTIWVDKSGKGNNGELINFNFATNGWNPTLTELVPDETDPAGSISKTIEYKGLVCNNDAYVRIPYKALVNNALNGFTLEMVYTPEHSGNNKARVLEYVDHDAPYVGIYADIDEAFIKSESETTAGQIDLDYESGEIQLDFVIDREKKLCLLYIDGICTRYWTLSDSGNKRESFAIDQEYIYLNFSALSKEFCGGTNVIRKFLCYERALSHDDIVNNWIANQPDLITMEEKHNWCYKTQIPKVQIYGDISNCSSSVPAYVRIKYISTDEEKYGASFDLESANSPIYLQGTSSLGYARKNYRFILIDNNGQEYFHEMFPGNALPESTYTAKCDYVDSSMACNVTLCKIANDTLYGPNFTIAQKDNPARRTATYGHAIELVNIVNNEEISLGAYTIIIDRYAEKSMGYDQKEYPNILVAEGESNSDTGASSFHSYSNPESSGSQFPNETAYINEGFRIVYPPTNEDAYDFAPLKELVNFVDLASDDDFKDTFESYFDKESVLKYYLFCLCFASVDTLAKNLHFVRYKDVWYVLPYDLDSVLGGSNVGFLNISSSCEVGNIYDEENPEVIVEPNQFNSWNGRLWERMRNTFGADLKAMWTTLRVNGTFNYDNFIKYFDEIWDVLPPTMYNASQQIKYIDYGTTGQVALHGNRKHQIKKFLRERLAYLDSKFEFYSDGGSENYVNIRMNTLGDVSLTVETYYPVYYTIKWATNNIETHRIAKNTKKTFSYFSDVSTDREVLLYLPHTLKKIEGLDSLKPASIDISKATKLNEIECHSEKLYSVSLANNKYLRTIDFNGCNKLGTDTVSTLSIIYAKYLKYLDVRGTKLTAINFSNQGGSLQKCYLPNTLTTLNIKNQLLLTDLILPYSNDGSEMAKDLATVEIENCPAIVNISEVTGKDMFDVFRSCRSLILNNSFTTLSSIVFDGFTRLQNVNLSNIDSLVDLGLNDLCNVGETSSLRYIGISACKNLKTITMNCTSNDYEITFAKKSLLDLSTSNVTEIHSNCVIKGLETIILPKSIENMYFTKEYGEGYSDIKNIWSASAAVVDSSGVFPSASHMDFNTSLVDDYEGIDFYGLHLYNIDLGALVNIPDAINFSLYPTSVNPNFNLNRDGVEHPLLQPSGVLDLSNYTESLAKFFNGVDLDRLYVACRNDLPQTDLSYCFYGSSFSSPSRLNNVLNHITTVSNMEYCFYGTSTSNIDVLNSVNFLPGTSLRYCFAGCPNITELSDVTLSGNIGDASYMFSGSGLRSINNVSTSCGTIIGMFSNCHNLVEVNNFTASATTSYESLFEGCGGMTVAPIVEIPSTIVNISKMYKDCSSLVSIDGMVLHGNIIDTTEFIAGCNNLINANNVTIAGSFYNDIFRGITSLKYVNNLLINYVGRSMTFANMFDGCTNLIEMSFHDDSYVRDVISMDYMFRGTSMKTVDFSNVNFEKIVSYKYMFSDCLMEEFSLTVPKTITSIQGMLSNCRNLKTLKNFTVSHNVTVTDWLLDTPIENLINCSFYNQNTSFKNNTTLKKIEGFNYTGNNLANYFEGCSSLQSAKLTIGSKVTKANNLFTSCPLLTTVEFNAESNLSNVTTISDMFNGDNSLTTIKNLKITNSSTVANNTTLKNCPISNTDGLYINSNSAIQMFRMGTESKITQFTDFELGTSCDNLFEAFKDYQLLIKDILLPPHVVNVSYAFSNCIAMENIVSNWTNSYDRNNDDDLSNDVITEGCYEGSNNIKYIDNELYMNEYGELTAMQYIPPEWGGNASYEDNQTVFDVKITEDNLTYTMLGNVGECKTNWGDGTEDMNISHEYSKPGTYTIITENTQTFAQGTVVDSSISSPIVKFRALNKSLTNGSHLFDGWTNLLKVNKLTNTFNSYDYMFNNCSKLVDVDLSGCTLSQTVTTMAYMCNGCSKFTKLPISVIPDTCTNISYLFANSGITDISGMTFGSGINTFTSWVSPKVNTVNNVTVRCSQPLFQGCTTLVSIDNFTVSSNVNDISSWFEGCAKLSRDFEIPSHITNCTNTFKDCVSITHVNSNWNKTYTNGITSTDCYAGCTGITHIDEKNVIAYNGDLGLDYIPLDWGGNGFTLDCTMIYELNITDDFLNKPLKPIGTKNLLALNESVAKVNWGDGSPAELLYVNGKITEHNYTAKGTYFVKAHASMGHGYGAGFAGAISKILQVPKYEYGRINSNLASACSGASNMTYVDFSNLAYEKGVTKFNLGAMFMNCNKLKTVIIPSDWIIDNCSSMCQNCHALESFDFLKDWDVSKVSSMYAVFSGCKSLKTIDLSNWDVRNLQSSSNMFSQCSSLEDIIGLENWELNSVTNMSGMFNWCSVLNIANRITTMKINSGVKDISRLFYYCRGMSNIDLSNWYLDGVTNMSYTFSAMSILTEVKIPNFNLFNLANINYAFTESNNLTNLEFGYNLNIEFGYSDIKYCTKLTQGSVVSLLNGLYDRSDDTSLNAEIGTTLMAKLTSDQIAIATNKNWTVI